MPGQHPTRILSNQEYCKLMIPVGRFSIYTASIDEVFQLLSEYLPGCRFAQNIFYLSRYDWFNYHVILI